MTARDRLAAIAARAEAATAGAWQSDHMNVIGTVAGWWGPIRYDAHRVDQDAEFIAHARADVPALVAFATAVLDLADRFEHDEDAYSPRSAQVAAAKIDNLAQMHLGGAS